MNRLSVFEVAANLNVSAIDYLVATGLTALLMHSIARRYEPTDHVSGQLALLFIPPILLSMFFRSSAASPGVPSFFLFFFCAYIACLSIVTAAYRLSPFHPLASYPGPLPARVSKFWMVWKASNGKQHIYYRSLHEKYGDFVRIGPNELSVYGPDTVVPVLVTSGLEKGPVWDGRTLLPMKTSERALIALPRWSDHNERRKNWNRGFSTAALKHYEDIVKRRGKQLVEALERRDGSVDLAKWCGFFTFDFMGDMVFGGGFELMRDEGDKEGVWDIIENSLAPLTLIGHVPWLSPWLQKVAFLNQDIIKLQNFATKMAKSRIEKGPLCEDLWYHLFEADNSLASTPFMRVTQEAILAIVAGADTTSVVLSAVCFFMCEEPSYLTRLQAEVDANFPNSEEPFDSLKLAQMPLLNAIINEAMRMMPSAPSGSQRAVPLGVGGKMIGSNYLPEGTSVSLNHWALHRDSRSFSPYPDSFWPDRWLSPSERKFPARLFGTAPDPSSINDAVILNTSAYIPFLIGPGSCVGKNLALLEMRMVISLLVQKFDMRFAEGYSASDWWKEAQDWYIWKIGRLLVQLTVRF